MHVTPVSKANVVGCANDLKPLSVTLFRYIQTPSSPVGSPPHATRDATCIRADRPVDERAAGGSAAGATRPSVIETANSLDAPSTGALSSLFASTTRKEVTDDAHDEPRLLARSPFPVLRNRSGDLVVRRHCSHGRLTAA
jgi:hypothetical protein